MQYHIECGETLSQLEHNVKARLLEGWQPCGGVAVLPGPMLAQAVIKREAPSGLTREALCVWRLCNGLPTN